jgi:hypothetical protein
MTTIYLASVTTFSGKSLIALALGLHLREQGLRVGYFKPIGSQPTESEKKATDEDALFISRRLGAEDAVEALCPILLTEELEDRLLAGLTPEQQARETEALAARVTAAFREVARDKDVVLVGGIGELSRGSLLGLSAAKVAELLEAKVLLLAKYESASTLELVLLGARMLGDRLRGVIFNFVPPKALEAVAGPISRYLEGRGLPVLGAIPEDRLLASIMLGEIVRGLPAKALCCENRLGELVGNLVIGAMSVTGAIKYFRETSDKLVITGGDRPDIQLAALQTSTKGILLTGNLHPSPPILKRAQELGVPLLLTPRDTLSAVEAIEEMQGRLRVRAEQKVTRARQLLEEHLDLRRLTELVGV